MNLSLGKKIAAASMAGAILVGGGAVAWAEGGGAGGAATTLRAQTIGGTASAGTATRAGKGAGKAGVGARQLLRRADHGTLEIRVKGNSSASPTWQTVTYDRGKVSAVSATQISLGRPDGQSVTLHIGSTTTYRGVSSWQQVRSSSPAIVLSVDGTARIIAQRATPAAGAPTTPTPTPAAGGSGTGTGAA